jgi:hypothetical protein
MVIISHDGHKKACKPSEGPISFEPSQSMGYDLPCRKKKYSSEELEPATYLKWITTSHRKILLRDDSIKAQL